MLAPAFAAPLAAAQSKPVQPKINLPVNSGGESDGSDDVAPDAPSPEDQPETAAPATPVPIVVETSPGPETVIAPDPTPEPALDSVPEAQTSAPQPTTEPAVTLPEQAPAPDPAAQATPTADPVPVAETPAAPAPEPPTPAVTAPVQQAPAPGVPVLQAPDREPRRTVKRTRRAAPKRMNVTPRVAATPAVALATPAAAESLASESVPPAQSLRARSGQARRLAGGRAYRVRPGDSLWLIAQRLLGDNAGSGRTGALAMAIYKRNAAAIGTGDPDVLPAGITIILGKESAR